MRTATRKMIRRIALRPQSVAQRLPERGIPIEWQVAAVGASALEAACAIRYSGAKMGERIVIPIIHFKKWVRDRRTLPAQLFRLRTARLLHYKVASGGYEVRASKPVGAYL